MLNSCTFQGRLTRTPELRRTNSGKAVTSFSIAVEDDFKSSDGDKTTTFVEIVAWGSLAELVERYLDKGRMVIVSGRLSNRDWTDKDGNKRRSTEIIANNVYFCDSKKDSTESQQTAYSGYSAPTPPAPSFAQTEDDDYLPW